MNNKTQDKIMKILKASTSGAQMEEIADKLKLTRHTVAKYLEVLRAEGKIFYKKVGRTKLWKEISTTTIIRILKMEDIEFLVEIQERIAKEQSLEISERLEFLRDAATYNLQHGEPLVNLGAEVNGKLIAYVLADIRLWEFGRGERTGWIKMIGVDPDFQGRGIGQKLGSTLLEHFKRMHIKRVRTLVDWYEGELISFFRSLDFNLPNMIVLEKEIEEE